MESHSLALDRLSPKEHRDLAIGRESLWASVGRYAIRK